MEWWKTTDIVNSFADAVNAQMNKAIGSYTNKYKELMTRNAQNEAEAKAKAQQIFKARANAKRCANAEDRLRRANEHLLELGFTDQIPITQDTINREMSGGFASDVIQQALTGSYQAREKELLKAAEHDVKLTTPNWNKMTYEAQQDLIQQKYQAKVKALYPEGRYSLSDPSSFTYQYSVDKLTEGGYMQTQGQREPVYDRPQPEGWATLWREPSHEIQPISNLTDYEYDPSSIQEYAQRFGATPEPQTEPIGTAQNVTAGMTMPEYIPESKVKDVFDAFLAGGMGFIQNAEIGLMTHPPSMPDPNLPYPVGTRTTAIAPEWAYGTALGEYQGALQNTIDAYIRRREGHQEFWNEHPELAPRPEWTQSAWEHPELFKDAGWWGYTIMNSMAYTIAVMGTMVVGSAIGSPAVGIPAGLMVAAIPETGDMLNELVARGVPIEQARKPAEIYGLIAGGVETVSDLPFLGLVFKPLRGAVQPFLTGLKKVTANTFARKLLTGVMLTQAEAAEEVITQIAHNLIVKDFDKTQGILEGIADAWLQATIASLPFAGVGGYASHNTFHSNLEETIRKIYDERVKHWTKKGLTLEQAQVKAANDVAKTPEGRAALEQAIEIARDEYLEKNPAVKEQMEAKVVTLIPSTREEGVYSIKVGDESVGAVATFPQEDSLFVNRISIKEEGTLTRSIMVQLDNLLGNMAKEQGKQYLRIAVREENLGLYKRAGYTQEEGTNIVRKDVSEYQYAPTTAQVEAVKPTATAGEVTAIPKAEAETFIGETEEVTAHNVDKIAKARGLISQQEYGDATIAKRNQLIARYQELEAEIEAAREKGDYDLVRKLKDEQDHLHKFTSIVAVLKEYMAYVETGKILPEFEGLVPQNTNPAKPSSETIPKAEAVAKEPWQMTRKEATALYLEEIAKDTPDPNDAIRLNKLANNIRNLPEGEKIKVDSPYLKAEVSVGQSKHRVAVEGALSEGKPVPAEVLVDYPEFQTTALAEGGTITGEAFEGTVEVTGLEPVRAIRKIHSNWIARRTQYDATKKALVTYVKKHVPLEARGKMLTSVQNVKTPSGLTKAILRADGYAEQAAQKTLRTQITNQLKRISPKQGYGRFTAEIQGKLDAIKNNAKEDRAKVYERIGETIRAIDENKITIEDGQKALEILQVSGLKGMTSGELAFTLQEIKTLKATGRSLFAARKEAEAANFIPREIALDQATGGKGIKAGRGTVDTKDLRPRITKPKEFVTFWQYGLDDVLDWISRFSKTKPYQSVFSQIGFGLHMARSIQQKGVIEYENQTTNALARIYNVKKGRQLWQTLRRMKHDKIDLGTFINAANEKVDISLTKGQIIQKYLEMQDPTLDETFRNPAPDGMKWTDEIMTAVRGAMTKEDIEFANWLTEFYQEYGKTIKTVFEDKYHIPFPDNPHWVHLTRVKESGDYAHLLMAMNGYRVAGIGNKSLIARKANKIALKFTDVLDVHDRHIIEMEHFKAFAVPMKQARMIFGDKEARTAIEQYSGKEAVAHIDLHLDQIASDGKIGANIVEFIDKFRGHFTLAALGVKVVVSVKQALSLPAYLFYEQMPVRDFFTGVADFWAHPMQSIQEMKELSGHLSERWGSGHERDVRLVKAKDTAGRLSQYRNWRDLFMLGITKVDMATTSAGAWAVYKSMLKQGMSKADAITHAEIATDRTQPSFGLEDMAALRKQGSWGNLFTMFQSQPNKYYRAIASSIWNLKYGRGSKARNITTLLLAWWVLPALFQLVTDSFQWKEEHQARVAILGAGNYLLAGGQILQGMWGHITGEPHEIEATPLFSTLNEIEWSLNGINKLLEQGKDPLQNVDTDQLVTTIEHISKLAGQMAGVPTPYAVQLERAIRNHDPRQIIFSQYALSNEEDVNKEYRDLYAQAWGYDNWKDMPEGDKNTAGTKAHFNSLNS